jgi:hypothetical protein
LGTPLTLRNAVERMLYLLPQTSLRNALSLMSLDMHILLSSVINNSTLQIVQILPPLTIHSGNVLPHNMCHVVLYLVPHSPITLPLILLV